MRTRVEKSMWYRLIRLDDRKKQSLQSQLREALVKAILEGRVALNSPLPSSRELARQLNVARNTVVLAYQHLIDERYLIALERRGYFVNPEILEGRVSLNGDSTSENSNAEYSGPLTELLSSNTLSQQRNINRPVNWQDYEYPFIYGQTDPELFPVNDWRESSRLTLSVNAISEWARDGVDNDDELLIRQIHTKVLPRRGVWAQPEEILITTGAQNALYLLAQLLLNNERCVGLEDPCYADARNMFSLFTNRRVLFNVGESGVEVDDRARTCDVLYVTPSHQCPTTSTLPLDKRHELLFQADLHDFVIIEDDYESELNFVGEPTPALKSLDKKGSVIYVGSLSKTLAPGLRVGFMVGPKKLIEQARALRRLMYRHPASNNQRTVGHFLALGHHDSVMLRISQTLQRRWVAMDKALSRYFTFSTTAPVFGGSSFWVALPLGMSASKLEVEAARQGIIISAGDHYFASETGPKNFFRLGFSSIAESKIEPGIQKLAKIAASMQA